MSLSFNCPRCGKQILIQYLRPGDEALCRSCGEKVIVPETAAETDARPDYMLQDQPTEFRFRTGRPPQETEELASRFSRFLAALVDGVVMMVFAVPLLFILFTRYSESIFEAGDAFRIAWVGIPSLVYFIGINSYFWATRGQSIGKMALAIKIVQIDGRPATLGRIVGLRVLPMQLLSWIPLVGSMISLVDILMIFRPSRRCLHDEIARTKVIRCVPPEAQRQGYQPDTSEALNERRRQWQGDYDSE